MKVGNIVLYKGQQYWIIAPEWHGLMEIATTKHGAGSFMVLADKVILVDNKSVW